MSVAKTRKRDLQAVCDNLGLGEDQWHDGRLVSLELNDMADDPIVFARPKETSTTIREARAALVEEDEPRG